MYCSDSLFLVSQFSILTYDFGTSVSVSLSLSTGIFGVGWESSPATRTARGWAVSSLDRKRRSKAAFVAFRFYHCHMNPSPSPSGRLRNLLRIDTSRLLSPIKGGFFLALYRD
ncbi:hypothetical protein H6P81_011869 [Aristolochia fimbriata]|uniref:Uncharacterized protein n=1 Tax=Aristolochia fimbriata TaxID=158543 RepID=A0AAV7EDA7_ARIFI|nr:hypothetical protein H6P81_011869 [Aristolochia fimbriata]